MAATIGSIGTKLGVVGAVAGGEISVYHDVRNDKYDNVDKTKAVTVDALQTAVTIGSIFVISAGVAFIPVELPVLATIGVIGLGIGACIIINREAQVAKKEWIN